MRGFGRWCLRNIRKIPFQISEEYVRTRTVRLVEKLCTRCERLSAMDSAFAHFSLACYVPIRDNPALSNSDCELACSLGWVAQRTSGAGQHIPARLNPVVYRKMQMVLLSTAFSHLWK